MKISTNILQIISNENVEIVFTKVFPKGLIDRVKMVVDTSKSQVQVLEDSELATSLIYFKDKGRKH